MDAQTKNNLDCEMDQNQYIVIDNGSNSIKVGYSGENQPRSYVDSISGKVTPQNQGESVSNKPYYIYGQNLIDSLNENKLDIQVNRLIENAQIKEDNWDQMKGIWTYLIEETLETNEIQSVDLMMIDSVYVSKEYRTKMAEILFEEMKVNSVIFMNSSTLTLFSSGETTGFVIESGHGITTVCPIYEGYPQYYSMNYSNIASNEVNIALQKLLKDQSGFNDFSLNNLHIQSLIKQIKHSVCEVGLNYDEKMKNFVNLSDEEKSYQLPDGSFIQLTNDIKYTSTEAVFNPSLIGSNQKSLSKMIQESFDSCDDELKLDCQKAFIISGGNSVTKGFNDRIKHEINLLYPQLEEQFEFLFDVYRQNAAWVGGSMISSINEFQQMAILRSEYEESGDQKKTIVHKRTF